jgi:hypothetical protein
MILLVVMSGFAFVTLVLVHFLSCFCGVLSFATRIQPNFILSEMLRGRRLCAEVATATF